MYLNIFIFLVFCYFDWSLGGGEDVEDSIFSDVPARILGDSLIQLIHARNTSRLKELRSKLARIDGYVVDPTAYASLVRQHAGSAPLNATSFYDALEGKSHLPLSNKSQSLYLTLKQRMTRDDLFRALGSQRSGARRILKKHQHRLPQLVDKYLRETPYDNHTFPKFHSKYWDPQVEQDDRLARRSGRRIYKGEPTTVSYYPFMVSVHLMGRFWCGGALYWHDLVITSASCLQLLYNNRMYRENPKVLAVRIGSNHSRAGGEVLPVMEVYFHPSYVSSTLENNIAVLRTSRVIKFTYHRFPKIISIARYKEGMPSTGIVMLLGWGVSKVSQKLSYEPLYLQKKNLPVYPNKFCQEIYGEKFITRSMFCAGTMSTGEGACAHDAGGPAIMNGYLVGIISFGPTICGYPDAPTVFTLVGAFADWIDTINKTMPEYYRGRKRTTSTTESAMAHLIHHKTRTPKYESPIQASILGLMSKKHTLQLSPSHLMMNFENINEMKKEDVKYVESIANITKSQEKQQNKEQYQEKSHSDESLSSVSISSAELKVRADYQTAIQNENGPNMELNNKENLGPLVDTLITAQDTETLLNDTIAELRDTDYQLAPSTVGIKYIEAVQNADEAFINAYDDITLDSKNNTLAVQQNIKDSNIRGKFVPGKPDYGDYTPILSSLLDHQNAGKPPNERSQSLQQEPSVNFPDPDLFNRAEINQAEKYIDENFELGENPQATTKYQERISKNYENDKIPPIDTNNRQYDQYSQGQHKEISKANQNQFYDKEEIHRDPALIEPLPNQIKDLSPMQKMQALGINQDDIAEAIRANAAELSQTIEKNLPKLLNLPKANDINPDVIQQNLQLQYELGTGQDVNRLPQNNLRAQDELNNGEGYEFTTKDQQWEGTVMGTVDAEETEQPVPQEATIVKRVKAKKKTKKRRNKPHLRAREYDSDYYGFENDNK